MLTNSLQVRFQKVLSKEKDITPRLFCRQLTYLVDSELIHLYNILPNKAKFERNFCLIAIGGYGRMELAPYSDIDLLYVYEDLSEEELSFIINYFNNFLYDAKKEVGYACRTLDECKKYLDELESFYAILDSRFLLGSESLYERYKREVLNSLPESLIQNYKNYQISKLEKHLHSPLHISEPNLKNGPFGLRDIQTIYWLEKSERELPSLSSLAILPVFSRGEVQLVDKAYEFYLKVRFALHIVSGRKVDTLSIPLQPLVAEFLGFGQSTDINAIDSFMKTLYEYESDVYSFISTYLDYKKIQNKKDFQNYQKEHLYLKKIDNTLYPDYLKNIFYNPDTLYYDILKIFQISIEENFELSPILLNEIRFASNFLEENFMNSKSSIEIFLNIIKSKKNIGKILTYMHRTNILGKLFPEFGACTNYPLFSYHHHYSIDEHTLLILRELDRLLEGNFEIPEVQSVFFQLKDIHILVLAILLHDAGKVKEVDHCQYGAELSIAVGERLGLSEKEIDLLRFLVGQHILMSEISTKRDLSDSNVILDFITEVQDLNQLNLLYVLTIIDTKSVGRATLTNWKKVLLKNLYEKAKEALEKGLEKKSEPEKLQKELIEKENLDPQLARIVVKKALEYEPKSYFSYFTARRIYHHFLIQLEKKQELPTTPIVEIEREPAFITFNIYHIPNKFFLSDVTGAVSSMGFNLIGLRTFSYKDEFMIQTIQFTDSKGSGDIPQNKLEKLKEIIILLFQKKISIDKLLSSPSEWISYNKIPEGMVEEKIEFNNSISSEYTVLEICLPDSLGLLHRILKSILSHNVNLYFVRVATSADYAYDSFYLKDKQGQKISNQELMNSIKESIIHASKEKIPTPSLIYF